MPAVGCRCRRQVRNTKINAVLTPREPPTNAVAMLEKSLQVLQRASKADVVAETIIRKIQTGEFTPDHSLPPERELVLTLGVGRSTVREAVKQLVSQNILEIRRGRGTFVAARPGRYADPFGLRFQPDKLRLGLDVCEIRLMVEPHLARHAALAGDGAQVERIAAAQREVAALIEAGRHHEQADVAFHTAVAACTPNRLLDPIMQMICSSIPYLINVTNRRLCEEAVQTHRQVLEAILAHNGDAAYEAMALHIRQNRDDLAARIAAQGGGAAG